LIYNKKSILISLFLILPLQISFAQINNTSNPKLDNTTTVTIEDSIVGEKLEQVQNQNQSNTAGKIIEELVSEEEEPKKE
jgi:hypothetical protein